MDHGNMNQGFTIPGHALIIFGMAAIVEQPGKRPFDDPAPGQDGKTGAFFFDAFQVDFVTAASRRRPML